MTSATPQPPAGFVLPNTHHVWIRTPNVPVEHQGFLLWWFESPQGWMGWAQWFDQTGQLVGPQWVPKDWIRPEHSQRKLTGTAYS
jgi:hypothetical protein